MRTLREVEDLVAESGLNLDRILDFMRLMPTSDPQMIVPTLNEWVEEMEQAGVTIDHDWLNRVYDDLNTHGRLTHETIIGAPPAEQVSL